MERVFRAKNEILEGVIPAPSLVQLGSLLNQPRFRGLTQQDIPQYLSTSSLDAFSVGVFRVDGWQNLSFQGPESRKNYRDELAPMLKWLDTLQKQNSLKLPSTVVRNRCMPPLQSTLTSAGVATSTNGDDALTSSAAGASNTVADSYLLIFSTQDVTRLSPINQCTVIYTNGKYHSEQIFEQPDRTAKAKVLEGSVADRELDGLKAILGEDALRNLIHSPLGGVHAGAIQVTRVNIPRDDHIQKLIFVDHFRVRQASGLTEQNIPDDQEYLLKPLREWLKKNIKTKGASAFTTTHPSFCAVKP